MGADVRGAPPRRRALASAPPVYRFAVALALAVAGDLVLDPVHRHVPLCPLHALTGWQCPLCGGLRAVYELAHLRIGPALRDNVLVVAVIPVAAVLWVRWASRGSPPRAPRWARPALVALAVLFTLLRNLPPMGLLRP